MSALIRRLISNDVFANVVLVIIIIVGYLAATNMIREFFPEFTVETIFVEMIYPGADPEEIEEGINRKIEEAVDNLEGIKRYTTVSSENAGRAIIEVREDYDVSEVYDRVRNAVDSISSFPIDAEKPILSQLTLRNEVLYLALWGGQDERTMKEWAERIKDELQQFPSLSQVSVFGTRDYEIGIEVSEDRLREYGFTFAQVAQAVRRGSLNMSAGVIRTKDEEIRLRTVGRKYTGADFAKIVLLAKPNGDVITLDRVADIRDGFTEDPIEATFNGQPSVMLGVFKTPEEDAIAISEAVHAFIEKRQQTLPSGVNLSIWTDRSYLIRERIDLLSANGMQGLILVFLMLWLFLDLRLAIWVSMGIPISLAGAMGIMWAMGGTLNMISLFGMIMVLGIIVDDAIVVGEAIYVHRKNGDPPLTAAVNGVMEVGMPVIGAVTTTIVAFIPLMFVGGIMGKFIAILPVVVIAALTISMVESLFTLPAH
ncbi:MAG: efflux RND transporter permease subunit, partial [Candidatus Hydrogenedentales bacterium]